MKPFLKECWDNTILDITIIELIEKVKINNFCSSMETTNAAIHQYNPFNDHYEKKAFSAQVEIFPDKLQNLHGHKLNVGYNRDFFLGQPTKIQWAIEKMLTGSLRNPNFRELDASPLLNWMPLTVRVLSKAMNFTYIIKITKSIDVGYALLYKRIDFASEPMLIQFITPYNTEILLPFWISNHLIIKQYPCYKISFAEYSAVIAAVFILILIVIAIAIRLLKFDRSSWSIYNIVQIILGNSVSSLMALIGERILYLSLIYVYIAFSEQILNILVDINFQTESFIDFKTFEDVDKAGVVACLNHKEIINEVNKLTINNTALSNVLSRTVTCDHLMWLHDLYEKNAFNASIVNSAYAKLIHDSFSKNVFGWVFSLLEEPLSSSVGGIKFAGASPYVDRFQINVYRLYESSVINLWMEKGQEKFARSLRSELKNYFTKKEKSDDSSHDFYMKIILIYLIGCSITVAIFILEILWHHINRAIEDRIYYLIT